MNMAATPVVGAGYISAVESLAAQLNAGTAVPAATLTVNGTVKKAALVPVATVPFADLTAAANAYNALRTALINAGVMSAT
jgi:predicted RNase H-like nuclease (RuvC/YqgF family)